MRVTRGAKADKREMRREMRLTRPPRLEGKVKNSGTNAVRKQKKVRARTPTKTKPQGYTSKQRKNYQLRSKRHG